MANFVAFAKVSDIPPGTGKSVTANNVSVALFNVGGSFHAVSNTCPHRGGPLGEGDLEGTTVTCPWHGFQFDVASGASAEGKPLKVASYPTRVVNGVVEVAV